MPTYPFKCDVCLEKTEETLPTRMRDEVEILCSKGHRMRRAFSAVGFLMMGKFSPEYWGYTEKRSDGLTPLAE